MTDPGLAQASDVAVWVAMGLLTLAMLAFAAHLAITGAGRERRAGAEVPAAVGTWVTASGAGGAGEGGGDTLTRSERAGAAPTRRWGVLGLQLTLAATFALLASVTLRGLSVQRAPLGNMYEFAVVAATFALVIYSGWALRRDRLWLGLFVTLPVLLILGGAYLRWYTEASPLQDALNSYWLVIHVTVATLTVAILVIGCATALLYLARERAERSGEVAGWRGALPRATVLERITYGLHVVGFPLWTFTVIAGAIWAEQAWGRYWGWDAKEVWSFVVWVVYAAYLHARATSGWSLRRATWIAVAGMGCIVINYAVVNVYFVGLHSYSGL